MRQLVGNVSVVLSFSRQQIYVNQDNVQGIPNRTVYLIQGYILFSFHCLSVGTFCVVLIFSTSHFTARSVHKESKQKLLIQGIELTVNVSLNSKFKPTTLFTRWNSFQSTRIYIHLLKAGEHTDLNIMITTANTWTILCM